MKVCLYSRVSTAEQDPQKQVKQLRLYAENHGYEIVKVYTDVISGTKSSRPALNELMQDAFNGEFEKVIIWKLDRLGRGTKHLLDILTKFQNWNIHLVITTMQLDTNTPHGKFFFTVAGAFAEFERAIISERTKLGLKHAKNVGKRGKDKKPRKWRADKGKKRGPPKKPVLPPETTPN